MTVFIGDAGGIRVAPETVPGTLGTVWAPQHARSSTLGLRKPLLPKPRLGMGNPATRKYGSTYNDGEIGVAFDQSRAVVGDILELCGNLDTNDFTIGDGSTPDLETLSAWVDFGGTAATFVKLKPQSLRFNFAPDAPVEMVLAVMGGVSAYDVAPVTITPPSESGVLWEMDLATVTVGGASACIMSGNFGAQFGLTGSDRHCLGAGSLKKAEFAGPTLITGALEMELEDTSGSDSEAFLEAYNAGTALGDLVVGPFTLVNCYMNGEPPALGEGITTFSMNVEAQEMVVTTTA